MPMSEHDPTWKIADNLGQVRVWELIEARVTLALECAACHRRTTWPPDLLKGWLKAALGKRLVTVAGKLRCAGCRSRFVRISRDRPAKGADPRPEPRPDPALARGFTAANLDANARKGGGV